MRIGIDVRYLSHGLVGGVHAYVLNFVPDLIRQARDHEIVLYADRKAPFELSELPPHVTLRYLPWRHGASSVVNDLLLLRRAMAADRIEVAHFPANYGFGPAGAGTVITLHDQLTIMPLSVTLGSRGTPRTPRVAAMTIYLYLLSRLALRSARYLLTVSEYSRREIASHGGFDSQRIIVAPSAPAPDMVQITDATMLRDVRERYNLRKRIVLADALKNPGVIARAWPLVPADLRATAEIVFFARRRELLPAVHEAVEAGYARLLLRIPRADLTALYCMADAFLFPSWFEGLGLPLIEAMRLGAPIIAADRCSIPEVTAGAALLCDAEDERALARHLATVLGDPVTAGELRERGFRRAEHFSWPKAAARILSCYHMACHNLAPNLVPTRQVPTNYL